MASTPPVEFHALTDTGRVRAQNEDAVAVHPQLGLMLLADGMGGYNAGEVASRLAVEQVAEHMRLWLTGAKARGAAPAAVAQALQASAELANRAILETAQASPHCAGMGTTLVAGVLRGGHLILGHAGDSRGYRLREGALQQITRDHSWLQEQIDAGLLTPEQAAVSGQRNLVTRALVAEDVTQLDVIVFDTRPGDLYLLCSDGLTEQMPHGDLQDLARQPVPLAEKARRMVALANALGGRDNISVVLAQLAAQPTASSGGPAAPPAPRPGMPRADRLSPGSDAPD